MDVEPDHPSDEGWFPRFAQSIEKNEGKVLNSTQYCWLGRS